MMKSYSIFEDTKMDTMELFILETLLKGESVIIPDFGHLELINLGERRTVLFKKSNSSDLLKMVQPGEKGKMGSDIYTAISLPLKEGKTVNLPQIGVFRPIKREGGDINVSFIPSSSLRKLLNSKDHEELKEVREIEEEEVKGVKEEIDGIEDVSKIQENKFEIKTVKPIKTGDEIDSERKISVPMKEGRSVKKPKSRNISGILLVVVAIIFVLVIVVSSIRSHIREKEEQKELLSMPATNDSISLPALAEQHYGNSAFWIYIYEANMDKLTSPINIPKDVSLVIPDLKKDFDVDVTDSLEIRRANITADSVLKNIKNKTNK